MRQKEATINIDLQPLDARMRTQERLSAIFHSRLEGVSSDLNASFKELAKYQIQTEQSIETHFATTDGEIAVIKDEITVIKATMATKDDLAASEKRVLDAFRQLISMVETRLPAPPAN
ncbi:MAG: hypothetical protein ABI234_20635 [Ktedonobacteraceae bacterium]